MARAWNSAVVLLDIEMPHLGGVVVANWLRGDQTCRHAIVVACTSMHVLDLPASVQNGLFDGYYKKPSGLDDLCEMLQFLCPVHQHWTLIAGTRSFQRFAGP
ncbi:response regulator [Caballeronia calidae]|uniref:Response regulator n=2 Tax=Caballeronia calidae TaxID=1777139 RepID=A0A158CKW4_9BURK|nr:response regulator [Caballeronia calidae]